MYRTFTIFTIVLYMCVYCISIYLPSEYKGCEEYSLRVHQFNSDSLAHALNSPLIYSTITSSTYAVRIVV